MQLLCKKVMNSNEEFQVKILKLHGYGSFRLLDAPNNCLLNVLLFFLLHFVIFEAKEKEPWEVLLLHY